MARWENTIQTNQEVHRLKRDAVLREAGRLFSRNGYHNTSLDEVASTLGVSKGTLYNYVTDKQDILFSFHQMALAIARRVIAEAQEKGENGLEKIKLSTANYIREVGEELGGYGVIAEISALKPEDRKIIIEMRSEIERAYGDFAQEGAKDGSLSAVDPKMAIFTFFGAVQLVPNWFSPEGNLSPAEVADAITDILIYGMATPS